MDSQHPFASQLAKMWVTMDATSLPRLPTSYDTIEKRFSAQPNIPLPPSPLASYSLSYHGFFPAQQRERECMHLILNPTQVSVGRAWVKVDWTHGKRSGWCEDWPRRMLDREVGNTCDARKGDGMRWVDGGERSWGKWWCRRGDR